MASLETTNSGNFHIVFWFSGERYKRALRTRNVDDAKSRKRRLEETLRLVESGRLEIPQDIDVPAFLLSDGKRSVSDVAKNEPVTAATLEKMMQDFFHSIPAGNLEATTLSGMHRHEKHLLVRVLHYSDQ